MSSGLHRARSRQMVIFLLVCLGIMVLLGRLYYWQIVMGGDLAQQANDEHIQNQVLNAPRGLIYDAEGRLLATNVVRYDVYIEPIQFASDFSDNYQAKRDDVISSLRHVLPQLSIEQLQTAFESGLQTKRIAETINSNQGQQLQQMQLPDIFLQSRTVRTYPDSDIDAQILGYVQPDGKAVNGIEEKYTSLRQRPT